MTGAELIAAERTRQVSGEGWTDDHDDEHGMGEMAAAAMCYAQLCVDEEISEVSIGSHFVQEWWPWDREWWKPSPDSIRNLTKAGALLAAEIDRLQRISGAAYVPIIPIGSLDVSVRLFNCLYDARIFTLNVVAQMPESEFARIKNAGIKTRGEMRRVLSANGLSFAPEGFFNRDRFWQMVKEGKWPITI